MYYINNFLSYFDLNIRLKMDEYISSATDSSSSATHVAHV